MQNLVGIVVHYQVGYLEYTRSTNPENVAYPAILQKTKSPQRTI